MMIVKSQDPTVNTDRFELDPDKGVINIGSDEENDIVIQHPSVRPFHMMLAYGEKPYQIIPLDPEAEISIRGVQIRSDSAIPVNDLNDIRFGDFSFAPVVEGMGGSEVDSFAIIEIPQAAAAPENSSYQEPLIFSSQDVAAPVFLTPETRLAQPEVMSEIQDDVILVELAEKDQSVEVDQTATYHLNIINGGPIVASFDVTAEGVPAEWVNIYPPRVNLFEGGKAAVVVTITPPRKPTSTAGPHSLCFTVTSPNHAGRKSIRLANLEIAPFYDFGISDVTPMRRVIPFRKRYGSVDMEVRNRGNCPTHLRLMAQDDGNECQFHFLASNGLMQLSQVEYAVPAGEIQIAPIHISPIKRNLVRFTPRQHPYRVSVTQTENETMSLFSMGTAIARPLFGILEVVLTLMVLAGITFFLFTPRISYFNAENSVIGLGESTTLRWRAFFFTHDLSISGVDDPIKSSSGEMEIFPTETVNSYQLTATTWLWKMLNLTPKQASFTVLAVPSEPSINTFVVGDNDVLVGDFVLLRWSVSNASKVLLTVNGVTDVFENPEDFNGERNLFITADTLVSIEAINALGSVVDSEYILAQPPSIVIKRFEVNKTSIYKGEQVTIIWEIEGTGMADGGQVMISAFESVLPLQGELTFFPEESMEFVLTVTNREAEEVRILPVGVLDPAAPPEPPTINFFTAAPETLTGGGKVELAWSVTGVFQTLTITNGKETIASNLSAQGFRTIEVAESGTYILTAVNADKSAGKELTITVNPDKLQAVLSITSVDLPTAAMIGSKAIVGISCEAPDVKDPPPTGKVIISDGTASCEVALPVTSCEMAFTTPGHKVITATYLGDDNYIQSESAAWSGSDVYVLGNDLNLQLSFIPSTGPFYFGQKVDLKVFAIGSNPIRNPLGTIMLKRVCDPDANYLETCAAVQEGLYTLKAEDGGVHVFEDLVIDQLGGNYELTVIYTNDDYYEDSFINISSEVSGTILSPLSFSTTTNLNTDYLIGDVSLNVSVTDANTSELYSVPKGYVEVTALHSDGTTRISCDPVQSNLTAYDGRSSRTTCTLTPTKAGTWTISATFTPVSDIWHTSESGQIGTLSVIAGTEIGLVNDPGELTTLANNTLTLNVMRTDFNTQVATGTLACSGTDLTCNCSYRVDDANWQCVVKPNITSVSSSTTRSILFSYTPVAGEFLDDDTLSDTFAIRRANTVASMTAPATLASYYIVDTTFDVTIAAVHALGGDNPTGNNNVTIQLGSNTCNASTGMSSPITEVTASLGTPKSFKLDNSYNTGSNMRFCYRYNGDGAAYNASPWVSSTAFLVRNTFTTLTITAQPTAGGTILLNTGTASITVNVANGEGGTAPTAGDINFKLGYGTCSASSGMTTGTIGTITDGSLSGSSSLTKTVQLSNDHVVGQDIKFCVRYEGHGNNSASAWVESEAFRVKTQPTIPAVSTVEVVLSPDKNDYTLFSVTVSGAISPASANLTLVDANNTVICPAQTTNYDCTIDSISDTVFTYRIASNLPGTISLTPKYAEDAKNKSATGTAFTVDSRYEITWSIQTTSYTRNLSTLNPDFLTFSSYENVTAYDGTDEEMVTFLKAAFSISNYSTYDNAVFGLTPKVMKVIGGVDGNALSTEYAGCSPITAEGVVNCSETKVDDANTAGLRIILEPSSSTSSYYKASQLSSNYVSVNVLANVIENPKNSTYNTVNNCYQTDGVRYFTITGYTEQALLASQDFENGNLQFQLECVYMSTDDWCYDFYKGMNDDTAHWTDSSQDCSDQTDYSITTSNMEVAFTPVSGVPGLYQYVITLKNDSFGGCPGRGGYIEEKAHLRFYFATGASDYETFEATTTKETNDSCN